MGSLIPKIRELIVKSYKKDIMSRILLICLRFTGGQYGNGGNEHITLEKIVTEAAQDDL